MSIPPLTSRRRFFAQGGALLGAGLATTAGAAVLSGGLRGSSSALLDEQLAQDRDREALRALHLAFTSMIENERYAEATALFDEQAQLDLSGVAAKGRGAIAELLVVQYGERQAGTFHGAYRANALQANDTLVIADDHRHATAIYHLDVALCSPVQGSCTAAQMARMQGNLSDRRWESGRMIAQYVKVDGQWRIAALRYLAA